MPDLATHLLAQTTLNQLPRLRKIVPFTLFGAVAPDLMKGFSRWMPPPERWFLYPFHSPVFMIVFFYAISLLFHESERKYVLGGGFIGMVIHLALDLCQVNLGGGYYMPFFPFSFHRISFGLFATEETLHWLPLTLVIAVAAVVSRRILVRQSKITSNKGK